MWSQFRFANFLWGFLLFAVLCVRADPKVQRNYIKEAVLARATEIGASGIKECVETVSSRRNFDTHTVESVSACVCSFKHEVASLSDPRFGGLSQACKKPSRMPAINPYDSHFNIKMHCSSYGVHKSHPMCALF